METCICPAPTTQLNITMLRTVPMAVTPHTIKKFTSPKKVSTSSDDLSELMLIEQEFKSGQGRFRNHVAQQEWRRKVRSLAHQVKIIFRKHKDVKNFPLQEILDLHHAMTQELKTPDQLKRDAKRALKRTRHLAKTR